MKGHTAITRAACGGHVKSIQLLLQAEANVGIMCKWESLQYWREQKTVKLLWFLFSAGYDLREIPKEYLKEGIPDTKLSLKNICREAIRNHLLQMSNVNLIRQGAEASAAKTSTELPTVRSDTG